MTEALRHKLRVFGVPIDGLTSAFCDNEAAYQSAVVPESALSKKHHSIAYHMCREAVASGAVQIAKEGAENNLADALAKALSASRRRFLLDKLAC